MTIPHKHAAVIHAYADGKQIQWKSRNYHVWEDIRRPVFYDDCEYRVKPEKKKGKVWVALFSKGNHLASTMDEGAARVWEKSAVFTKWIKEGEEFEYEED